MGDHGAAFLAALFDGVEGSIEVRPMTRGGRQDARRRKFTSSAAEALEAVRAAEAAGLNVLVGVATRTDEGARAGMGTKAHLARASWCWVDVDASSAEADEGLAKFEAEHGLRAGMVVRSSQGGGLHAYFRLAAPVDLRDSESLAWLENVNRGLVAALGADPAAVDASRVLRVPGTTNRPDAEKHGKTGRGDSPCTLERAWDGSANPREAFARLAECGAERRRASGGGAGAGARPALQGELPERVRELLSADERLRQRFEGVPSETQSDRTPSGVDWSLACMLAYRGVPAEEIAEALQASGSSAAAARATRSCGRPPWGLWRACGRGSRGTPRATPTFTIRLPDGTCPRR